MTSKPPGDTQLPAEVARAFSVIQVHFSQLHPDMDVEIDISLHPKPADEPPLQIRALSFNRVRSSGGESLPLDLQSNLFK